MRTYPEERFVRLKHEKPEHAAATLTLTGVDPSAPLPTVADHGVLARIAAEDPQRANVVLAGLLQLMQRNDEVMAWLESSAGNAAAFADDPAAALLQALPDLPAGFFDGWRAT